MSAQIAAVLAVVVLAGLIVFQLLLASGKPLGEFAWGGQSRLLPRPLRIASLVATLVYATAGAVVLEAAGVIDLAVFSGPPTVALWAFTILFAIGVPLNAISRSRKERVMALVSLALFLLFLYVAL